MNFRTSNVTMNRSLMMGVVALSALAGASSAQAHSPRALSAFFGDSILANQANAFCTPPTQAGGFGGMPIVFSEAIDTQGGFRGQPFSLNPAFFRVRVKGSGWVTPTCATLQPAVDGTELRTLLLAGEFGLGAKNRPVQIEVVGPVRTVSGASLQGLKISRVDELNVGPRLVLAERFLSGEGAIATSQDDDDDPDAFCPADTTSVVVKLTFSGGPTGLNNASLQDDPAAIAAIQILGVAPNGARVVLNPFALRDIDGDNHLDACLGAQALNLDLQRVAVDANVFFSPQNASTPAGTVFIR